MVAFVLLRGAAPGAGVGTCVGAAVSSVVRSGGARVACMRAKGTAPNSSRTFSTYLSGEKPIVGIENYFLCKILSPSSPPPLSVIRLQLALVGLVTEGVACVGNCSLERIEFRHLLRASGCLTAI